MKYSENIARGKSDKLESYLKILYMLLRDLLVLREKLRGLQDQIVEIVQALRGQRFLVGAVDEVQNLDRLELRVRRLARRCV